MKVTTVDNQVSLQMTTEEALTFASKLIEQVNSVLTSEWQVLSKSQATIVNDGNRDFAGLLNTYVFVVPKEEAIYIQARGRQQRKS